MRKIKINEFREIDVILDYIHDKAFSIEEICFDKGAGELRVAVQVVSENRDDEKRRFLFLKTWKSTVFISYLYIFNVLEYSITDRDEVGEGLINTILFRDNIIRVVCSNAVDFSISVSYFSLALHPTDEIAGEVRRFSIGRMGTGTY